MPSRRDFLKILGVIAVPIPELTLGGPVILYMSLTSRGWEVTERVPVEFRWNHAMTLKLGEGHNFTFNGLALFDEVRKKIPIRVKNFDFIRMTPAMTLEISYILRKEE